MNANQIINMIIRRFMRVAVNKGVDMSIKGASNVAKKATQSRQPDQTPDVYIDDHGNTVKRRNPKA